MVLCSNSRRGARGVARRPRRHRRSGALLVWGAFLLIVLIGMTGLVIDVGLLMAAQRNAQNAADSAALAAAHELLRGASSAAAVTTGETFVTDGDYYGLTDAAVAINVPPARGAYAGSGSHAEALVTAPNQTFFIHVLPGVAQGNTVHGRAVAGYELVQIAKGVIALNPDAKPGLKVSGRASLVVNGAVIVNSEGGGVDENGDASIFGNGQNGTTVNNNGLLQAESVDIVGGVNSTGLDNIENIDPDGPHPLHANQPTTPDPLQFLPTPTTANGVIAETRELPNITAGGDPGFSASEETNYYDAATDTVYMFPGIYEDIQISGGTVVFARGIYVISPPETGNSGGVTITGGNVSGDGIMFYNTGHNYDPATGSPDSGDALSDAAPPPPDGANFADFTLTDSVQFTPLNATDYPVDGAPAAIADFDGLLYYQRRLSDARVLITGESSDNTLTGTWYSKWGDVQIDGQGTYQGSFVVGSLKAEGQATMTIDPDEDSLPKARQIFLVE